MRRPDACRRAASRARTGSRGRAQASEQHPSHFPDFKHLPIATATREVEQWTRSGGWEMVERAVLRQVVLAGALGSVGLMVFAGAIAFSEDRNYHPICETAYQAECIPPTKFVVTRKGGADCINEKGALCFGVGNDGWDTEVMWPRDPKNINTYRGLTGQKFDYATLEYRSTPGAGRFQDAQRDAIIEHLNDLRSKHKKVYLFVFVHGWHHSAREEISRSLECVEATSFAPCTNPQDRNLFYFKHLLAKTSFELTARRDDYAVMGVYVGWDGGSSNNILAADRGQAADRIGRSPDLMADLKKISQGADAIEADGSGRMLVMGHSFGGRMVSRLMLKSVAENNWTPFGPRSLVVTLNPAIGADAFDEVMKQPTDASRRPAWINITSMDDRATGIVFSLASTIGRLIPKIGYGLTDAIDGGRGFHAIGHYEPYVTHRLKIVHLEDSPYGPSPENRRTTWYDFPLANNKEGDAAPKYPVLWFNSIPPYQRYSIELSKGEKTPPGRMWNVSTDSDVIGGDGLLKISTPNHNAFVQTSLNRMLLELTLAE